MARDGSPNGPSTVSVLVDGDNVLRALRLVRGDDLFMAEQFLQRLERFAALKGWEVTVVFDGPERFLPRQEGPLMVRYAPAGSTADSLIERLVFGHPNRREVVVVTQDRALSHMVLGLGAHVWEPKRLQEEMARPPE